MQDRISLYPGRVKLTPVAGQDNVFDLVRADQPTQEGTALNKGNLLADDTAALFGIAAGDIPGTVPDDVLKLLSRFQAGLGNEYVWVKIKENVALGTPTTLTNVLMASWNGTDNLWNIQYADTAEKALKRDVHIVYAASFSSRADYINWINANLKGKWFYSSLEEGSYQRGETLFYFPNDATATANSRYFIQMSTVIKYADAVYTAIPVAYLNAQNADAYPPEQADGFVYTPIGQFGGFATVEIVNYIGTGMGGENYPNSITFATAPDIIRILANNENEYFQEIFTSNNISTVALSKYIYTDYGRNNKFGYGVSGNETCSMKKSTDGKTISWYFKYLDNSGTAEDLAQPQFNKAGVRYVAIGISSHK